MVSNAEFCWDIEFPEYPASEPDLHSKPTFGAPEHETKSGPQTEPDSNSELASEISEPETGRSAQMELGPSGSDDAEDSTSESNLEWGTEAQVDWGIMSFHSHMIDDSWPFARLSVDCEDTEATSGDDTSSEATSEETSSGSSSASTTDQESINLEHLDSLDEIMNVEESFFILVDDDEDAPSADNGSSLQNTATI
ncbi:hypothetical protein CkaCkLH20_10871 [Colletotrichum karsti]|uniref:Uncharacterized protein n=1 Tax=Colletotrichum karsti TaxID=1095194 RepID=A0A9P6HUU6_9PEZI|nr:uncharacterized protein CkaCkLH20_10871 [Colletotrichum karsti]KAF9871673.1 hypothetical protein CkaCkLH20_10871 [Colletotrichum karsti]